ncbi:MAG: PKD domain-containing protein [Calditrichaeota bacterium]|nr:MAG: PKD domain-containing protein [Calditrichota bacterium]
MEKYMLNSDTKNPDIFLRFTHYALFLFSLCMAISTTDLFANTPPEATITQPTEGMIYSTSSLITFEGSGTDAEDGVVPVVNYTWLLDMPDGTINYILAQGVSSGSGNAALDGDYVLKLVVQDSEGLTDTAFVHFSVANQPLFPPVAVAEANVESGDTPLMVLFMGSNSSDSDGSINSYDWDFKDGYTSTSVNPAHEFQTAGTFNVELIVTDNDGLKDTAIVSITANPTNNIRPTAILEADQVSGDPPLIVQFTGSNSSDVDGNIASYSWDFGDNISSFDADPLHIYSNEGFYYAQLIVTDNGGLKDTADVTIKVGDPVLGGIVDGAISGIFKPNQSKLFHHKGDWWITAPGAEGGWYLWQFIRDSWKRKIQVDDSNNSSGDTFVDSLNNKCYILFSQTAYTRFTRLSFDGNAWSVDPGFPVQVPNFTHVDEDPLSMTIDKNGDIWLFRFYNQGIQCKYSTDGGQTWSTNLQIKSGLTQPTGLTDATIFRHNGTDQVGVVYGENTGSGSQFGFLRHEVGTPGAEWIDESDQLIMWPNVHADNHVAIASDGNETVWIITKTGSGGGNSVKNGLYKRTKDGWQSFGVNVGHSWTRPAIAYDRTNGDLFLIGTRESLPKLGEYKKVKAGNESLLLYAELNPLFENGTDDFNNITVTQQIVSEESGLFIAAENMTNDQIWTSKINIAKDPPNAKPTAIVSASPMSGEVPLLVDFTGSNSTDPNDNINVYSWDFGDTYTASSADVRHVFSSAGTFDVRFIVRDEGALADTAWIQIVVHPLALDAPVAVAEADTTSGNAPLVVQFTGSNSSDADGVISNWAWEFGDGLTSTQADPNHRFTSPGEYNVRLVVTDNSGLVDTTYIAISVGERLNQPPVASIILPVEGTIFSINEAVNFSGTARDPEDGPLEQMSFSWSVAPQGQAWNALATGVKTGSIQTLGTGDYQLMLIVEDREGLLDTSTVNFSIRNSTGVGEWMQTSHEIPKTFVLSEAYPNPFTLNAPGLYANGIRINLGLPTTSQVTFHIFNMLGQRVATLMQSQSLPPGYHAIRWNGNNSLGRLVPNGVYFFYIQAGAERRNVKVSVVR